MGLSTDINLPRSQAPRFPDICVVCGAKSPNHKVKIGTNTIGWMTLALWLGSRFSVNVPACKGCGAKLQLRRWGAMIAFFLLAFAILFLIGPILSPHIPPALHKWCLIIATLICLCPFFVWESFFPPAIEITAFSKTVDYEFRNENYATRFALLNRFGWDFDLEDLAESDSDQEELESDENWDSDASGEFEAMSDDEEPDNLVR